MSKSIQVGLFGHEFDGPEWDELLIDTGEKAPRKTFPLSTKIWLLLGSIKYFLTPGITLRAAKKQMYSVVLLKDRFDFTAKDTFYSLMSEYKYTTDITYAHGKVTFCSMVYNMMLLETLKKNNTNSSNKNFIYLI